MHKWISNVGIGGTDTIRRGSDAGRRFFASEAARRATSVAVRLGRLGGHDNLRLGGREAMLATRRRTAFHFASEAARRAASVAERPERWQGREN